VPLLPRSESQATAGVAIDAAPCPLSVHEHPCTGAPARSLSLWLVPLDRILGVRAGRVRAGPDATVEGPADVVEQFRGRVAELYAE